jgi:hypothetical protein
MLRTRPVLRMQPMISRNGPRSSNMTVASHHPTDQKAMTVVGNPESLEPALKCVGGSQSKSNAQYPLGRSFQW